MTRVVIVGAGGHGQVVADILFRMRDEGANIFPVGYVDDNLAMVGRELISLPVMGTVEELAEIAHDAVIIAVGDNQIRRKLFAKLLSDGEQFTIACHPRAVIAPDAQIGVGTMVSANAVVNPGSEIGPNVILNTACTVDHHNKIGAHVHIAPGVHLGGEVTIGAGTLIGIGATVMPRCRVGDWSVVSAGAVVNRDLPDQVTAAGSPARIIKQSEDMA